MSRKTKYWTSFKKWSLYHISPTEEATRKYYLEAILLRGNHKLEKLTLNAVELETTMYK